MNRSVGRIGDSHAEWSSARDDVVRVGSVVTIRARSLADQDVTIVDSVTGSGLHQLTTRTALGRALIGHRAGDEVKVETDAGTATFIVVHVRN